jgi:hypothetical protein
MDRKDILTWILVSAGAFSICGGAFDWDWFMNSRKAQFWLKLFGRQGARMFYVILGVVIAAIGVIVSSQGVSTPK